MTTPFGRASGTRYGTASTRIAADSTFEESIARLDALAMLLDGAIRIPGTKIVMGLDALLGLVPVIGDSISGLISSYIIFEARRLGAPRWLIAPWRRTRRSIPFWAAFRFSATCSTLPTRPI